MDGLKTLAQIVLKAQEIRENSWSADSIGYSKTLGQSVSDACGLIGNDWYHQPAFLLCYYGWNDAHDWATEILKKLNHFDPDRIKVMEER